MARPKADKYVMRTPEEKELGGEILVEIVIQQALHRVTDPIDLIAFKPFVDFT